VSKASPVERAEALIANVDFASWLHRLANYHQDGGRFLLRGPVVGAIYGTYRKSKSASREFWEMVKTGDGRPAKAPDRKLRDFLMLHSVQSGRGAKLARATIPKEFFVKSILAWNAWRRNEPTDLKYYHDAKRKVPVCV